MRGNMKVFLSMIVVLGILNCWSFSVGVIGIPKHHTTDGFRNYPIVSSSTSPGFFFYLRRIEAAFHLPNISEDHYFPEEEAIQQFQNLARLS